MVQTLKPLPHVLIFPLPFQGPVNCALKLAELICLSGIHVTFLNTEHMHRLLLRQTNVMSRFNGYPSFKFQTVPDGVEHETPVHRDQFMEVMASVDKVTKPLFREMIVSGELSRKSERPVRDGDDTGCILSVCCGYRNRGVDSGYLLGYFKSMLRVDFILESSYSY